MPIKFRFQVESAKSAFLGTIAYPLYAALLEQIPKELASSIHEAQSAPISQYFYNNCWYVSLLEDKIAEELSSVLEKLTEIHLRGEKLPIVLKCTGRQEITAETLLNGASPAYLCLSLRTPTAFKSGGFYQILPEQRFILQSAMNKWNNCFGECPIEDEDGGLGLDAMAAGLIYKKISLQSRNFKLKGTEIPGTTGNIIMENRLEGFHHVLANALLQFSGFAGIGIKTALGMGGAAVLPTEKV